MRRMEWLLIGLTVLMLVIICLGLVVTAFIPDPKSEAQVPVATRDAVVWGGVEVPLPAPQAVFPGVAPTAVSAWPEEEERWEVEGWLGALCWSGESGWALATRIGSVTDVWALHREEEPTKLAELALPLELATGAVCGPDLLVVADPRLDRTWLISRDGQTWSTPGDGVEPMVVDGGTVWGVRSGESVTGPSEIAVRGGEGLRIAMSRPGSVRDVAVHGSKIAWAEKGTDLQTRVVHGLPSLPAVHTFDRAVTDVEILGDHTWIAGAYGVFEHDGVWTRVSDHGTHLSTDGAFLAWAHQSREELHVLCPTEDDRVLDLTVDPHGGDALNPARVAVAGPWILVPDMGGVPTPEGDHALRGLQSAIRALANPCYPEADGP